MAKTNKTKAPKFNATLTIPAITLNTKTLLELARTDRYELEDILGSDQYLPTPEAMLQNPAYLEHLQKVLPILLTGAVTDLYEDSHRLTQKKAKAIFKDVLAKAAADKKKVDDERRAVLNGNGTNTAILKISGHDAERVKNFLNRNDMPFVQVAHAVTK